MNVLIVENDVTTCETLKEVVESSVRDVNVVCFNKFSDAHAYLKKNGAEVLILDHFTYRMSEHSNEIPACRRLLVLSSLNRDDTHCLDKLKIDRLFKKPLDSDDLINYIEKLKEG